MTQQPVDIDYIAPSIGILKELLQLTQQDKLTKLCQKLTALETADIRYQAFTTPLSKLANQFQLKAIEQRLVEHLEQLPTERLLVEV